MKKRLMVILFPFVLMAATDSCVECHSALEGNLAASGYQDDVHRRHGFTCTACHGGDSRAEDPAAAMSRAKGFLGKIARTGVPDLCGQCHSDANLMHKFNPKQRIDQVAQYRTSVHGKRLVAGDTAVATCIDCHGVHGIREVKHSLSPVHPLKIAGTCARCHSDATHMARYELPVDQLEGYRKSVHWEALAKRGDTSAPNCASCHGNHGATPPQVTSVAAVCGTCHVLMEDLFRSSPHAPVFEAMGVGGCAVCHGNHEIRKASTEMLAGEQAVCAQCHEPGSHGAGMAAQMAAAITGLEAAAQRSEELLERARRSGMEVSEPLLAQKDARENLVKARVAVHSFRLEDVQAPVEEGMEIAAQTYQAGEDALSERDFRRLGLGGALVAILLTMAGLWVMIRVIERPKQDTISPAAWR
jgi:hypothetical protein